MNETQTKITSHIKATVTRTAKGAILGAKIDQRILGSVSLSYSEILSVSHFLNELIKEQNQRIQKTGLDKLE